MTADTPSARGPSRVEGLVTAAVVAACVAFVLVELHPQLLVADTTPAGGDMGAHVWGPAYLRDHLLPHWRLTGWSPDWYSGFPAYHFYMVVPSLLIVALDVVLPYGIAFKVVRAGNCAGGGTPLRNGIWAASLPASNFSTSGLSR